jgi:hypothetical protein
VHSLLYSVEVHCRADELVGLMSRMREWLDNHRFEPDVFPHSAADDGAVTIHVQFKSEGEAFDFAEAFSGQRV